MCSHNKCHISKLPNENENAGLSLANGIKIVTLVAYNEKKYIAAFVGK